MKPGQYIYHELPGDGRHVLPAVPAQPDRRDSRAEAAEALAQYDELDEDIAALLHDLERPVES